MREIVQLIKGFVGRGSVGRKGICRDSRVMQQLQGLQGGLIHVGWHMPLLKVLEHLGIPGTCRHAHTTRRYNWTVQEYLQVTELKHVVSSILVMQRCGSQG